MGVFVFLFLAVPLAALVALVLDGVLLQDPPLDSDDRGEWGVAGGSAADRPDALWMRNRPRGLVLVAPSAAIAESVAVPEAA